MFMVPEITEKQQWVLVDGKPGCLYVPEDCWEGSTIDLDAHGIVGLTYSILPTNQKDIHSEDGTYKAGEYTVELVEGFGCRFSAPGYLDCTEWNVFATYKEAYNYFMEEARTNSDEEYAKELRSYMRNNFIAPSKYRKGKKRGT